MMQQQNLAVRVPPYDEESEKALLGSMLLHPDVISKIMKIVKPEYFYTTKNRIICYCIFDLVEKDIPVDLLTLGKRLTSGKKLDEVGGLSYVTELSTYVPSHSRYEHYAKVVKDKYKARRLLELMELVSTDIYNKGELDDKTKDKVLNLNELIDIEYEEDSQNSLMEELANYDGEDRVVSMKEIYDSVDLDKSKNMYTGWVKLDERLNGIRPSHLIVLAGQTKNGKTTFAMDMSTRMQQYNPLWLAIEETMDELMYKFKERNEPPPNGFSPKSIMPVTIKWIEKRIAEGIKKYKSKIVIIDNLSWIKLTSKTNINKADMIEETMQMLKALAKKWEIVIFIISHVNGESSADKNPTYENLKGSSGIAQIGDKTIMVWREVTKSDRGELDWSNNTNVSVQLNRQGGVGNVKMVYDNGHYTEYDWVQNEKQFGDYADLVTNKKLI